MTFKTAYGIFGQVTLMNLLYLIKLGIVICVVQLDIFKGKTFTDLIIQPYSTSIDGLDRNYI